MRIDLAYDETVQTVDLPDEGFLGTLSARHLSAARDVATVVREALQRPIGSPPLAGVIRPGRPVTVVIGDTTRSWSRPDLYLPPLLDELNRFGVPDAAITVISATGTHRPQTPEERRALVGPAVLPRVRFVEHDSRDQAAMVHVGTTSRGTPVRVNRVVAGAEQLILSGAVTQHFLAGYGGGRKAIVPGVAAYETIQTNHKLSLSLTRGEGVLPTVDSLLADGNAVSEDMAEAAGMLKPCFGLNVIVNEDMQIARIIGGHWEASHRAACDIVRETVCCGIPHLADLVIVSNGGYPKDINMWQSSKTIDNAARAVAPGGVMLWLTCCRDGLGAEEFATALEEGGDKQQTEELMRRKFTIGALVTYVIQKHASRCRVLIVTALEQRHCRQLGLEPVGSAGEGLRAAHAQLGRTPTTYVMPHGGSVVPVLRRQPARAVAAG
ncbi:MAG: nickel-dependent lactate racemase [Candidatus Rokubacteria bacterium]|nr:nickel-dependent lactate racemase [Candidatus Rokubacteria bacterium]